MILESQILFFFSAMGAFNGFFLSAYFAFIVKDRNRKTYFLSALLFVVSVRITKSAFLHFNPGVHELFIDIGLTACALIGPFLYLYVRETLRKEATKGYAWLLHVVPYLIIMIITLYLYPYKQNHGAWFLKKVTPLGNTLYTQWLIYVLISARLIWDSMLKLFKKQEKLSGIEIWLINIVFGIFIVWLAYRTSAYTSYIVGALSFSFVFYVSVLLWVFRRKKAELFSKQMPKYANKKIPTSASRAISAKLEVFFKEKQPYKNPDLKLPDVARELGTTPHHLSQYLNDNLGKSFADFVNEHRVNAAEEMLKANDQLTLEGIGYECGFRSNSSFYAAFKKFKGITPGQLKAAK